ncbi:MAG: hypothetical protein LBV80_08300 [Deltaproteobacteria bacterium]|nr:hypothetical protein [Deltaproteobacteria bacterium]
MNEKLAGGNLGGKEKSGETKRAVRSSLNYYKSGPRYERLQQAFGSIV